MISGISKILLTVTIACSVANVNSSSRAALVNGGYVNVVVAFAPDLDPKDAEKLIQNVQELFASASPVLKVATRGKAQFSEITLLVPRGWPPSEHYEKATFESFADADVRVDVPNPNYGDGPYTLQPLLCGSPGMYIHLTPGYLLHLKTNSTTTFGDPGKTLVHEWAHLRYGVFDEFGHRDSKQYPIFYYDSQFDQVIPNYCANEVVDGKFWNTKTNSDCDLHNGWPSEDCIFKPDTEQNGVTSSLTSYHFLKNVNIFCDDTSLHRHNKRAPNKHNALCNQRSAWDVIRSNKDFSNARSIRSIPESTMLKFKIVQPMEPTFSLAIDVSTSMNLPLEYSKQQMLREVISRWLRDEVPSGGAVGLITFNETAVQRWPMSKLEDDQQRQELLKSMPKRASGYTCIGCGLLEAMKQLHAYRGALGGTIILVTDGEENRRPFASEIETELLRNEVRVIAVALSKSASTSLEAIAKITNGKVFFDSGESGVQALGGAFFDAVTFQVTDADLPIKIHDERYTANNQMHYIGNFTVDSTIGNDTKVNFIYLNKDDIQNISINGPDTEISMLTRQVKRGQRVIFVDDERLIKFHFKQLKPGKYFYVIRHNKSTEQDVTVTVTSKPSIKSMKPIQTRCWTEKEMSSTGTPRFIIIAEVKQGTNPVINANVLAKIERPDDNVPVYLELFDNGSGAPDVTEDDGIYSRYFTQFTGKGRYTVKAQVTDNGVASIQESGFLASSAMPVVTAPPITGYMQSRQIHKRQTGAFERVAEGGSLDLAEQIYAEEKDWLPPSKVYDLKVDQSAADGLIRLRWTAPGDDFDRGQASSYEFRYSTRWEDIGTYFNGTRMLFNIIPQMAGQEEIVTVDPRFFDVNKVYFFAMKSYDNENHESPMSNVAQSVAFEPSLPANDKPNKTTVLLLSILGTVAMSITVVCAVICCRKRKKSPFR